MSTLISDDRSIEVAVPPATLFSRFLRWYRNAVAEPATEREKEEWQQNSF